MDGVLLGQTAAIITSCLWTINSILFANAGKRIGSVSVNSYRILCAVGFLSVTHVVLFHQLLPIATTEQWFWIGLSGIVGLGIGDFGLFAAFVIIGPRRSVLIMALSPIFAAVGGYLLLEEILTPFSILGIAVTLTGVILVILESEEKSHEEMLLRRDKVRGSLFAFIGAVGQGIGIVLAKKGILLHASSPLNPLSATLIRMILGSFFIWIVVLAAGKIPDLKKAIHNKQGLQFTALGAFVGPFLGVTFSMIAVTLSKAGIAQTLMSLMPVLIIPILWIFYHQKTSLRSIFGALIAVIGVAILFIL
jgi:drug/metabolite transporter (DMT)-like permease